METIRRIRATSLAALVVAGSAAPLAAQGDPAVSVSAPRAAEVQSGPLSPFSVLPDAVQSAGFRTSLAGTAGPMPMGDATPVQGGGSSVKLITTTPAGPTTLPQPTMLVAPPHLAGPVAPAWRWHGYGAVITTDVPPSMPRSATPAGPVGSAVSAIPAGPDVSLGAVGQPTGPIPAFTPPSDVAPAALPPSPQPLSAGEPAWKPVGEPVASANPMSTSRETWIGMASRPTGPIMTVSASFPVSHSPAVTLDAPRVAGTYIPRGVSESPTMTAPVAPPVIQQVSCAAPVARPTSISPRIRTGIERVCAGRGRDVDVSVCGPSSLLVRLKVRQPVDAEYLANAISRMPELAPYQVQFEMQVAR